MLRDLAILTLVVAASACRPDATAPVSPNLILITVDTLRADRLSVYGAEHPTSDRAHALERGSIAGFTLDEVMAQGQRFENAYSPRGMTFPAVCTIMTGRPPIETCALSNGDVLPPSSSTLAERLRSAGYQTAAFTTNKLLVPGSGIEQGFEVFQTDFSPDKDERMCAAAAHWIAASEREARPFFVWLHLVGPHLPYDPRPIGAVDFTKLYTDPIYHGPADGSREFLDGAYSTGRALSLADVEHVRALYDGEVARIDHLLSVFFQSCGARLDSALTVFTADHGEELCERNRYFGHAKSMYADVLHVPLVLRFPHGANAGLRREVVGLEDLAPTFDALLGLQAHVRPHGRSLLTQRAEDALAPQPQFSLWRDRIFGVRDERWRLVWNPERIEPDETPKGSYPIPELALYDELVDPLDAHDVASLHPKEVERLKQAIATWRQGLSPCSIKRAAPSKERLQALRDLGYGNNGNDGEH